MSTGSGQVHKVFRPDRTGDDDRLRFDRAGKILARLRHPNIPTIHHHGSEGGQAFPAVELCSGAPASSFVRPDHHLRPREVISIGLQLASALTAIHAAGIIYRDLYEGNVLLAFEREPKAWLFDFDLAQVSPEFFAGLPERWATLPERRREPAQDRRIDKADYAAPEVHAGASARRATCSRSACCCTACSPAPGRSRPRAARSFRRVSGAGPAPRISSWR